MQLASGVSSFLARVLEGYRGHPLFSPFLNVSREDPPQYFLHQCEVLAMLSVRRPVRVLIADEIGLGKTVTAIAVAKHLQSMGRARRVLVVVPRVLVYQWRKELERMGISTPRLLDRNTIDRYTSGFPEGFYLVSMDFLKRSNRISVVQKADWDLVIVDEAHRLGYGTQRFREIGKVIRDPHRDVLFLSATPHRGDPTDYIERLRLLDPHLVDWENLDNKDFYRYTHGSLVFRRTKEDINEIYEGRRVFTDARFYAVLIDATREEQDFVRNLVDFLRVKLGEWTAGDRLGKNALPLLAVLLFKRATSSPYAAMTTLQRLLLRRSGVDESALKRLVASVKSFLGVGYDDVDYEGDAEDVFDRFLEYVSPLLTSRDLEILKNLKERAASIMKSGDSKLNALVSLLESVMQEGDTKVVVFTEYRDTLQYLYNELRARHPEWVILTLSSAEAGDRNKFERIKRGFEKDLRARILLATDVVAE
ncbi:MAG: SNF2-related protein, partial [Pyrobaculum sp.]